MANILNYIGGQFVPSVLGKTLTIDLPESGEQGAQLSDSGVHEIINATQVCAGEGDKWEKIPLANKADVVGKILTSIEANKEIFEKLLIRYLGYSKVQGKLELREAMAAGQYYVDLARELEGVGLVPRGTVAIALPAASPLYYFFAEVIPAMLVGNRVILRPHPQTAPVNEALMRIVQKLELPPSALQLVNGAGVEVLETMIEHPAIRGLFFIGESSMGHQLHKYAIANDTYFQGSYGGRNSIILGRNVDFKVLGKELRRVLFNTHYLACYRGSRIFLPENCYADYADKIAKVAESVVLDKYVGPLSTRLHHELFKKQLMSLHKENVNVAKYGKTYTDSAGFKVPPCIAEDMSNCSTFQQDQSIGPLVTLTRYKTIREAVKFANTSPWGFVAYIFEDDVEKAEQWAAGLKVGAVFINSFAKELYKRPQLTHYNSGNLARPSTWEAYQVCKNIVVPAINRP